MRRVLVFTLVTIFVIALAAVALATPPAKSDVSHNIYRQYCASCHGLDGKGTGPSATALKTPPPDLTMLQKSGEKFPWAEVLTAIDGEKTVPSHGTRDMPIWGRAFRYTAKTPPKDSVIYGLMKYIESIQVNAAPAK